MPIFNRFLDGSLTITDRPERRLILVLDDAQKRRTVPHGAAEAEIGNDVEVRTQAAVHAGRIAEFPPARGFQSEYAALGEGMRIDPPPSFP